MALSVFVAMFLLQAFVVTDRESVLERLDEFVAAVVKEDIAGAGRVISSAYDGEGLDREAFIGSLEGWFAVIDIRDPRFQRRDVTVDGDQAVMNLAASATVSLRKEAGSTHWGVWRIEWRREAEGWSISRVEPVSLDAMPVKSLSDLRGLVP